MVIRIAEKYHEDKHYFNVYWADKFKINLKIFNLLEYKLLILFNFKIHVTEIEYNNINSQVL